MVISSFNKNVCINYIVPLSAFWILYSKVLLGNFNSRFTNYACILLYLGFYQIISGLLLLCVATLEYQGRQSGQKSTALIPSIHHSILPCHF